ncbi:MAG: hypothetical protein ABI343_10910 [Burkholderiaceae bacterium]
MAIVAIAVHVGLYYVLAQTVATGGLAVMACIRIRAATFRHTSRP